MSKRVIKETITNKIIKVVVVEDEEDSNILIIIIIIIIKVIIKIIINRAPQTGIKTSRKKKKQMT